MDKLTALILRHNTKDAIPDDISIFIEINKLLLILKTINIYIYFNFDPLQLRELKLDRFLKKTSSVNRIFQILHKTKITERRFHSVMFNSMSKCYATNIINISKERFDYLQTYLKYRNNYRINNDGNIIIYLNNPNGYYKTWINYEKHLPILIKNIRKYNTKNKIVIRFHRKHSKKEIQDLMNNLKIIEPEIKIDDTKFLETIKNAYCIFIQNASIVLDYINEGIPLFNPGFTPFNDYNECYNKLEYIKDIQLNKKLLINRERFLKIAYNYIIFDIEYKKNKDYLIKFYTKNILKNY